jgi:hypothetical protein
MLIGAEVVLWCRVPGVRLAKAQCAGYDPEEGRTGCRYLRRLSAGGTDEICECASPEVRQVALAALLDEMEAARNEMQRQAGWREVAAFNRGECPKCGRPLSVMSEKPWASFNGKLRGVEQQVSCPMWEGGCGEISYRNRIVVQEKDEP